jgi:hypothetical protein
VALAGIPYRMGQVGTGPNRDLSTQHTNTLTMSRDGRRLTYLRRQGCSGCLPHCPVVKTHQSIPCRVQYTPPTTNTGRLQRISDQSPPPPPPPPPPPNPPPPWVWPLTHTSTPVPRSGRTFTSAAASGLSTGVPSRMSSWTGGWWVMTSTRRGESAPSVPPATGLERSAVRVAASHSCRPATRAAGGDCVRTSVRAQSTLPIGGGGGGAATALARGLPVAPPLPHRVPPVRLLHIVHGEALTPGHQTLVKVPDAPAQGPVVLLPHPHHVRPQCGAQDQHVAVLVGAAVQQKHLGTHKTVEAHWTVGRRGTC